MSRPIINSILLEPVMSSHVFSLFSRLKSKSSYSHDDISTKLLQQALDTITCTHNKRFSTMV